ncbi:MAG: hypothetical protein ABJG88_02185 [Litorimonas sp.]
MRKTGSMEDASHPHEVLSPSSEVLQHDRQVLRCHPQCFGARMETPNGIVSGTLDIFSDKTVIMKNFALILIFVVLMISGRANAQNDAIADTCFPIERASGRIKAASLEPGRRDTVDTFLEAYFADVKSRSLLMKLYLKHDGTRDDFIVSETGEVEDFHTKVLGALDEAVICGPMREDGKIGLGMSTSVRFKTSSGTHSMIEILDGLKDGKSHHKKNLGGAKALFVPKMTHLAIVYDVDNVIPDVSAVANGESVPVALEPYGEMWVIDVRALEDSKVETITIRGIPYELFPVPSIKKMKSLGIK